jgi:hypothetical protein
MALVGWVLLGARRKQRTLVIRWLALAVIGGMLGYMLYAAQIVQPETWGFLPDVDWVTRAVIVGLVAVGALLPLGLIMRTKRSHDRL